MIKVDYDDLMRQLYKLLKKTNTVITEADWNKVLRKAIDPITNDYRALAQSHADTGRLARAVAKKTVEYDGKHVVITGPKYTKPGSNSAGNANHAWLVEYGTAGPRQPGKGKRSGGTSRALLVNDRVNRTRVPMNADDFANADPTRYSFTMQNARRGFKMTLKPGQTYGAMPAGKWMKDAYTANRGSVERLLRASVEAIIDKITKGGAA